MENQCSHGEGLRKNQEDGNAMRMWGFSWAAKGQLHPPRSDAWWGAGDGSSHSVVTWTSSSQHWELHHFQWNYPISTFRWKVLLYSLFRHRSWNHTNSATLSLSLLKPSLENGGGGSPHLRKLDLLWEASCVAPWGLNFCCRERVSSSFPGRYKPQFRNCHF